MCLRRRKFLSTLLAALIVLGLSLPALAESMPGMNMDNNSTATPSGEMGKNQAAAAGDTQKPPETPLDQGQQSALLGTVAGLFFVLPVGAWIVLHQRKRRRRSKS